MFEIVIRSAAELSAQEDQEVGVVGREAFASETPDDIAEWSSTDWLVLGKVDGKVVSHVGVLERVVEAGETSLRVGGIGGVSTLPAYQRRGYAGLLLQAAADLMRGRLGLTHALLICKPYRTAFYGRFGWRLLEDSMYFWQGEQKRRYEDQVMTLSLDGSAWPPGEVDLKGNPW